MFIVKSVQTILIQIDLSGCRRRRRQSPSPVQTWKVSNCYILTILVTIVCPVMRMKVHFSYEESNVWIEKRI